MLLLLIFASIPACLEARPKIFPKSHIHLDQERSITVAKENKYCSRDDANERPRAKRYVLNSHKWRRGTLSWSFRDPFHLIKRDIEYRIIKEIIRRALDLWSEPTDGLLRFKDVSPAEPSAGRTGSLDILFAKYDHEDKEAFDGPGGIIAHSGYPFEGIVHLDGSEFWSTDGRKGLDLRYVILHELGHALGLRHSRDKTAIMNPYYREQFADGFELGDDDIEGIQRLYGFTRRI